MGFFISNKWRWPKIVIGLFIVELCCTVPALALFAIADPDTYRTRLWEDGNENGFNSSPETRVYSLANRQPVDIPILWTQFLTTYNFVISIFSTFCLLVKAIMFIMHVWWPILSFFIHGGLAAIWAWSVWAQQSPDMSEPAKPQPGAPWYLTKSCSVAYYKSNIGYCMQAKACFAIAIVLMSLFAINTLWAIFSLFPSKAQREKRAARKEEEKQLKQEEVEAAIENGEPPPTSRTWMQRITGANEFENFHFGTAVGGVEEHGMKSPTTPRTQAFNKLGGGKAGKQKAGGSGLREVYAYA